MEVLYIVLVSFLRNSQKDLIKKFYQKTKYGKVILVENKERKE